MPLKANIHRHNFIKLLEIFQNHIANNKKRKGRGGSSYINLAGLNLTEVHLPLLGPNKGATTLEHKSYFYFDTIIIIY